MTINVKVGDTVRAWKWVYDRDYSTEGVVEALSEDHGRRFAKINNDYYEVENDGLTNSFEIIRVVDPATDKQIAYLKDLGWEGNPQTLRKGEASDLIEERKRWIGAVGACHYCGGPAFGWGFFDERACPECGGPERKY